MHCLYRKIYPLKKWFPSVTFIYTNRGWRLTWQLHAKALDVWAAISWTSPNFTSQPQSKNFILDKTENASKQSAGTGKHGARIAFFYRRAQKSIGAFRQAQTWETRTYKLGAPGGANNKKLLHKQRSYVFSKTLDGIFVPPTKRWQSNKRLPFSRSVTWAFSGSDSSCSSLHTLPRCRTSSLTWQTATSRLVPLQHTNATVSLISSDHHRLVPPFPSRK